ncbi:MAG: hypothetical protein WCK08_00285 [Betaproteobacteria bacterium]
MPLATTRAWRFGTDGCLQAIADPRKFGAVDKAGLKLHALACEDRVGFVFMTVAKVQSFDLDHDLSGMLDELTALEADNGPLLGKPRLDSANWKITGRLQPLGQL